MSPATSGTRRRRRPRRHERPGDGRPRSAPDTLRARARCTASRTAPVRRRRRPALGHPRPLPRGARRPARRRPRAGPVARHRHRLVGRRLRPARATGGCSATRTPTATRRTDGVAAQVAHEVDARRAVRTHRAAAPAVQHALPAGRRRAAPRRWSRPTTLLLLPDLLALLADRRARRRAHQRLDDRAVRRRAPASGPPSSPTGSGCPSAILPPLRRPRRPWSARCCPRSRPTLGLAPDVPRRRGRLARHRLRRRRRARCAGRAVAYISSRHLVAGRPRARRAGAHRGRPAGRLHQRGRRRRHASGSCKNVMGLWLLSESVRTWERDGGAVDLPALLAGGGAAPRRCGPSSTSTTRASCRPGDMPARIARAGSRASTASRCPTTPVESPAASWTAWPLAYRRHRPARRPSWPGVDVDVVHIVGGGSQQRAALPAAPPTARPAGARRPGRGDRARQRAGAGPRAGRRPARPGRDARPGAAHPRRTPVRARADLDWAAAESRLPTTP